MRSFRTGKHGTEPFGDEPVIHMGDEPRGDEPQIHMGGEPLGVPHGVEPA
jgi:hypothetical protein